MKCTSGKEEENPLSISRVANQKDYKYENFLRGAHQQNFRKKLSLKSGMVIAKEDVLFKARPSPK